MSTDIEILDIRRLMSILPHRYPCLMIDLAMLDRNGNKATGIKNVSMNEPFFQGHFPSNPVMPGILILEAMVQTGKIVIHETVGAGNKPALLKSISKAKFRKPVFPGDRLTIGAELIGIRDGIAGIRANATVLDKPVCQAEFNVGIGNAAASMPPVKFDSELMLNGSPFKSQPVSDIGGVINTLPHRYPFVLVDSILRLNEPRIYGLKNITGNEPVIPAHLPEHPVMPETLLVESIAQVGAVYILGRPENKGKLGYFMAIDSALFRRPVVPGDRLVIEVETRGSRARGGKARGLIHVGDQVVAEASITFVLVNRTAKPGTGQ